MAGEVEVGAMVDAFELLPPEGELVLNVECDLGVVRQLLGAVLMEPELVRRDAQPDVPLHPLLAPILEPAGVVARLHEELHLRLLELTGAENEVPGRDLVPKRLADLGDAERPFLPRRLQHVEVIDVDALGRLGAEIDHRPETAQGIYVNYLNVL